MSEPERIKVAVIGAAGRMGSTVCQAVIDAPDTELVGRFDVGDDLQDLAGASACVGDDACGEPTDGLRCMSEGTCSDTVCCGSMCGFGPVECGPSATRLPRAGVACGQVASSPLRGVLCCKDGA